MSVLAVYKDGLTAADESITDTIDYVIEDNLRPAATPPMVQEVVLLRPLPFCTRSETNLAKRYAGVSTTSRGTSPPTETALRKVIRVRQQLAQGTYDLDERLDAVLERLLMDVTH